MQLVFGYFNPWLSVLLRSLFTLDYLIGLRFLFSLSFSRLLRFRNLFWCLCCRFLWRGFLRRQNCINACYWVWCYWGCLYGLAFCHTYLLKTAAARSAKVCRSRICCAAS